MFSPSSSQLPSMEGEIALEDEQLADPNYLEFLTEMMQLGLRPRRDAYLQRTADFESDV